MADFMSVKPVPGGGEEVAAALRLAISFGHR
jgi:hypothetical protein